MTDMTDRTKRHLSGAAKNLKIYSAVKIITQAVSKQKKTTLYRSPHDIVPALPGRWPQGTENNEKILFLCLKLGFSP
jgi:hypothetical protein